MARYITISCVSQPAFSIDSSEGNEGLVGRIIEKWFQRLRSVLPDKPDLIVMPEYCDLPSRDFGADKVREFYRHRGARIRDALARIAKENRCYIAYTAVRQVPADGTFRNSMELIDREGGTAGIYHKNHLISPEREAGALRHGNDASLIKTDFGTVACVICFDLNFDRLRLHYAASRPDLILFSSLFHGGLMQQYWAYSCRSHFAAAIAGPPPCAILSPVGQVLAESTNYHPFVTHRVNLDCAVVHLDFNAEKLAGIKAKYGPAVRIQDPGRLGSVLLSSESPAFSVHDLLNEFQIETLDGYLSRCRTDREATGDLDQAQGKIE